MSMQSITWYIAGPMTGLPDYNYPAFHEAEAWIREHLGHGEIINPATEFNGDQTLPREVYLRRALENVARADALFLLPGWQSSQGACIEVIAADAIGAGIVTVTRVDDPEDDDDRSPIEQAAMALAELVRDQ